MEVGAIIPLENTFYYIISMIYVIAIIFIYSLSVYLNIKLIKLSVKNNFTWLLYYCAVISAVFVLAFLFILYLYIKGTPIDASVFAVMVIRPLIFLAGCGFVGTTRGRFISMERGGGVWEQKQVSS